MGNCSLKAMSKNNSSNFIMIITESGSILEFKPPKLAHEVLNSYPGHGIFPSGHGAAALRANEQLIRGEFYYLLPLASKTPCDESFVHEKMEAEYTAAETGNVLVNNLGSGSGLEVLPSGRDGIWRVKLMINTKQLGEILSEQRDTEALIERMRMAVSGSPRVTPRHGKSGWKFNLSRLFDKIRF